MIKKIFYSFVAFSFIATIVLSIVVSVKASELVGLERKAAELDNENRQLSEQIITKTSLTQAESEAQTLGLTNSRTVVYLNSDVSVAQLR